MAHDREAIADISKAIELTPNDAELYFMRGECKDNLQKGSGCADIRKALSLGYKATFDVSEYCK